MIVWRGNSNKFLATQDGYEMQVIKTVEGFEATVIKDDFISIVTKNNSHSATLWCEEEIKKDIIYNKFIKCDIPF